MSKKWRDRDGISTKLPEKNEKLVKMLKKMAKAPPATGDDINLDDIQSMTLKRMIRKKKGSWFQIHKDIKHEEN
jgi:hypothetical protein